MEVRRNTSNYEKRTSLVLVQAAIFSFKFTDSTYEARLFKIEAGYTKSLVIVRGTYKEFFVTLVVDKKIVFHLIIPFLYRVYIIT